MATDWRYHHTFGEIVPKFAINARARFVIKNIQIERQYIMDLTQA